MRQRRQRWTRSSSFHSRVLLRETYRPLGTWICSGDGTAHSTIRWRCSILVGRVFQAPRPNQTDRTPRPSPRGYGRKVGVISAPHHSFSGQLLLRTGQQLTSLPDVFVVRASLARIRAKDHPRPRVGCNEMSRERIGLLDRIQSATFMPQSSPSRTGGSVLNSQARLQRRTA